MTTSLGLRRLSLSLMAGTAAIALGHPALAQDTTIDTATTDPVTTTTTGDLDVTSSGSITLPDGTAITVDSDNSVTMQGDILIEDTSEDGSAAADDAIGVLVTGDRTFTYIQTGEIRLEDNSVTNADEDDENGIEPPDFAENRYGFRLDPGSYTGHISFTSTALTQVSGDNSAAIAVLGDLTADDDNPAISIEGDIIVEGENSDGLNIAGNITGDVVLSPSSSFNVLGKDSDGVDVTGDIDGAFTIGGVINVSGYQDLSPELPIDDDVSTAEDESTSEEAQAILARNAVQTSLTSGDGVSIAGNVTGGVLINGPLPIEFEDVYLQADTNGDGVIDENDDDAPTIPSATSISVFGSGNALSIDGGAGGITIGEFDTAEIDEARTYNDEIPDYGDWGLINRGTLTSSGLYPGVDAGTVTIRNATIEAGIRNDGNIDSQALRAAATGVLIGSGTSTPVFYNRGRISAGVSGTGGDAISVDIESGASLPTFINDGRIESFAISDEHDAVGFRDASGTVTQFTNMGIISAFISDDTDNDDNTERDNADPVGDAIAIDLSANTTGVTILSTVTDRDDIDVDAVGRENFGIITGDILTGSGDDQFIANAGPTFGDISLGAGNDTVDLSMGTLLIGSVDFGDGNDQFLADNASIAATLDFGSGNSLLQLSNDSSFAGDILSTGSVDIDIMGSSLIFGSETNLTVGSLTTASQNDVTSTLGFAISPDGMSIARVNAGTVDLSSDTGLEVVFEGAFDNQTVSDIIISGGALNLDVAALNASLTANDEGTLPILFNQSVRLEGNDLWLDLDRKSASELGIGSGFAAAFDPVISALTEDQELGSILFNATTEEEFTEFFNQVLAGPLDAPLAYARAQNNSVTSLVSHRVDAITSGDDKLQRRFWLQEEGYFVNRDPDASSNGFDGGGFVVAGGVDAPVGPIDALGLSIHYASARYDEQLGEDFPFDRTTIGLDLYYADRLGNFEVDGRVGYALTDSSSERNITFNDENRALYGEWEGTQFTANSRVRYVMKMGDTELRPFAGFDFVSLKEDAYTETGNESLVLSAEEREAESLRGNVGFELSRVFRSKERAYDFSVPGTFRPRLTAAWSQELLTDDYSGTYNFANGEQFTLFSEPESGAAIIGGDMTYENEYATVHFGASGTFGEQTEIYTLRVGIGLKW